MPPAIATIVYCLLILGLFWLDRDQEARTSKALWLPVVWVSLACSRSPGQWLLMNEVPSPDQVLEGSPFDRLAYMCLLAVGIFVLVARWQRVGRLLRANAVILLFFLYCAVSLLWSDYPDVAFKRWTKALGDLVMVLIVLTDCEPAAALKRLLARAAYVLIPLSILFIKYYPSLGRGYGIWLGEVGYQGVTTNKNALGVICLLFGLGSVWRFVSAYRDRECTGRTRRLIAHGIILCMVLWLFWIANSMTSLGSFLMASTLFLVANSPVVNRRPAFLHLLIALMLVVSFSVLFLGVSPGVLETMGRNPTLTDRTEVWGVLLSLVRNPLLGTGFESFWLGPRLEKMWSIYWWHPNEAHNGYLEIFLNLGWIGVALLTVVIAAGYRRVFRMWRSDVSTGGLLLAYFFMGLVYNFTEAAFFKMLAPAWIFFLFAITGVPPSSEHEIQSSARNLVQHPKTVACLQTRPAVIEEFVQGRSMQALHSSHQPTVDRVVLLSKWSPR
jgi:exopolysaccharide production protein ExoQ